MRLRGLAEWMNYRRLGTRGNGRTVVRSASEYSAYSVVDALQRAVVSPKTASSVSHSCGAFQTTTRKEPPTQPVQSGNPQPLHARKVGRFVPGPPPSRQREPEDAHMGSPNTYDTPQELIDVCETTSHSKPFESDETEEAGLKRRGDIGEGVGMNSGESPSNSSTLRKPPGTEHQRSLWQQQATPANKSRDLLTDPKNVFHF